MLVLDAGGRVTQVRFLPDGRLLVGLGSEGAEWAVEVWPLPSGPRVRIPLPSGTWEYANQLAVHPSGDRFYLACGTLLTVATADGRPIPGGPTGRADQVAALPDGRRVVTGHITPDGDLVLVCRDTAAGGELWRTTYPRQQGRQLAGLLPNGERYVLVGHRVVEFGHPPGGPESARAKYPSNYVYHPQLSPDGRHLGVIAYGSLYVYDTTALGKPRQIKAGQAFGDFRGFAFHPAGRTLAVIHGGPTLVKLYDLDTLTLRTKLNWKVGKLTCVAFSADGLLGAAGTEDGRVVVWDVDE